MRETGYYWCRIEEKWCIAHYLNPLSSDILYRWESPEFDLRMNDDSFDEIDEKQIKRE